MTTTIRVPDGDMTDGDFAGGNLADDSNAPAAPLPSWQGLVGAWRYEGGKRDLRFDFLRGLAVMAMVTDHVGGAQSWMYYFTGGNRFFVSAAEVFVFISGLVFGIVEFSLINRAGVDAALTKALKRVFTLYIFTTALSLAFALVSYLLNLPWAPDLDAAGGKTNFIVGLITLHRAYYLTDVLLLYVLLVLAAGPALLLMEHGETKVVLAASWGLWALWQFAPAQASFPWEIQDNNVFHFPAWQIFFINGLVIGFHRKAIQKRLVEVPIWRILAASGAVLGVAVWLYATDLALLTRITPWHDMATVNRWLFEKDGVRGGRLVVFALFMVFAYSLVTVLWNPLVKLFGWFVLPLGQHALGSYMTHLFIVALLTKIAPAFVGSEATASSFVTGFVQLAAIFVVWGVIRLQPVAMWLQQAVFGKQISEIVPS